MGVFDSVIRNNFSFHKLRFLRPRMNCAKKKRGPLDPFVVAILAANQLFITFGNIAGQCANLKIIIADLTNGRDFGRGPS